jgi:hypothetical protein
MNSIRNSYFNLYLFLVIMPILVHSCYSFKGISIAPDINTFYIKDFQNKSPNAPVSVDFEFSEALRSKIRSESKLKLNDVNPDVTFEGEIVRYDVTAEAPQEGNTVFLNKLEMAVQVKYTNSKNEKENYERVYSFFRTFPGDQDLQAVQNNLNKELYKQITENIFNETFTAW